MLRVLQVATTAGQSCGIGNFALNLAAEMPRAQVQVKTVGHVPASVVDADLVLVQYGSGVISDDEVAAVGRLSTPVAVFAHDPGAEAVLDHAAGVLAMAPGMLETTLPLLVFPHPAWVPALLDDRDALKARMGLPPVPVIGTSGFLMFHRQFPLILEQLLPEVVKRGWHVNLVTAEWFGGSPGLVEDLEGLLRHYPDAFSYTTAFAPRAELNLRQQACDILWCWTKERSIPSASGSVSDQYASGTHLYVTDKEQHEHILGLPNVTRAPVVLDAFVVGLVAETEAGVFARHDPTPVAWAQQIPTIVNFLSNLASNGPSRED